MRRPGSITPPCLVRKKRRVLFPCRNGPPNRFASTPGLVFSPSLATNPNGTVTFAGLFSTYECQSGRAKQGLGAAGNSE